MQVKVDGRRLHEVRMEKAVTVSVLSKESGVSRRAIAEIEKGKRPEIREATLFALARALGLSAVELEDRTNGGQRAEEEVPEAKEPEGESQQA